MSVEIVEQQTPVQPSRDDTVCVTLKSCYTLDCYTPRTHDMTLKSVTHLLTAVLL